MTYIDSLAVEALIDDLPIEISKQPQEETADFQGRDVKDITEEVRKDKNIIYSILSKINVALTIYESIPGLGIHKILTDNQIITTPLEIFANTQGVIQISRFLYAFCLFGVTLYHAAKNILNDGYCGEKTWKDLTKDGAQLLKHGLRGAVLSYFVFKADNIGYDWDFNDNIVLKLELAKSAFLVNDILQKTTPKSIRDLPVINYFFKLPNYWTATNS